MDLRNVEWMDVIVLSKWVNSHLFLLQMCFMTWIDTPSKIERIQKSVNYWTGSTSILCSSEIPWATNLGNISGGRNSSDPLWLLIWSSLPTLLWQEPKIILQATSTVKLKLSQHQLCFNKHFNVGQICRPNNLERFRMQNSLFWNLGLHL